MRCAQCAKEALPGQQFCADHRGGTLAAAKTSDIYATFWQRFGAAFIDGLAFSFVGGILVAVLAPVLGAGALLVYLLAVIAYYAGFESSPLQATPGKLAVDIKVTTLEGERIGFGRAVGRLIGKFVSAIILYIGYLMALFTSHRQALHDRMVSTLVVRKRFSGEEVATAGPAPPTSVGSIVGVIVVFLFAGIFVIGMLAAISIPAYQDYTVRAQITAGLNHAAPYKAAVAEEYASGKPFDEITLQSLQLDARPPVSPYVQGIEVVNGAIEIRFGGNSNRAIAGQVLVLTPATDESRNLIWVCGNHPPPPGATPVTSNIVSNTTVANKYLPSACRSP
jgi:uncharacterized RDD family membrane protein YckC/Tfp pilus assembly major pilin PilA